MSNQKSHRINYLIFIHDWASSWWRNWLSRWDHFNSKEQFSQMRGTGKIAWMGLNCLRYNFLWHAKVSQLKQLWNWSGCDWLEMTINEPVQYSPKKFSLKSDKIFLYCRTALLENYKKAYKTSQLQQSNSLKKECLQLVSEIGQLLISTLMVIDKRMLEMLDQRIQL